jgi:hypothetical protein
MELLNPSPSPILPRTMWVLYRALMSTPGLDRSELIEAVCPPTMIGETPGDGAHARRALDTLVRYSLISVEGQEGSETLSVHDGTTAQAFVRNVRQAMLNASGGDEPPPDDLRRGAAWLLSQAPNKALDQRLADQEVPGLFTNDTRWNTFTYWATFLGLGREWPLEGGGLSADPTQAVADAIYFPSETPLEVGTPMELQSLVQHVEAELPIISVDRDSSENELSHALAYAFRSLRSRGKLTFERRSDAPSVVRFPSISGAAEELYSHVTIGADA